jgi:DNA invertase Pin-like site-specific DNA recombinase
MTGEQKLTPGHLTRKVIVYLRQSSMRQVHHNKESQSLQYGLAERARTLGFRDVEVSDGDLGASAALGARRREDFERLLAQLQPRRPSIGSLGAVTGP